MSTVILPLHEHFHYLDECAAVLNEEWPLSVTARNHMLEVSNDKFPYSLVFVECKGENKCVIGHSRLVRVQGNKSACFVQSVVVSKEKRGQGYGRKLMEKTEEHALSLGITTVYLTTHDKQDFYSHVGYQYCKPINFSSSKVTAGTIWENMENKNDKKTSPTKQTHLKNKSYSTGTEGEVDLSHPDKSSVTITNSRSASQPLPPPPPPLPKTTANTEQKTPHVTFWMKKNLT